MISRCEECRQAPTHAAGAFGRGLVPVTPHYTRSPRISERPQILAPVSNSVVGPPLRLRGSASSHAFLTAGRQRHRRAGPSGGHTRGARKKGPEPAHRRAASFEPQMMWLPGSRQGHARSRDTPTADHSDFSVEKCGQDRQFQRIKPPTCAFAPAIGLEPITCRLIVLIVRRPPSNPQKCLVVKPSSVLILSLVCISARRWLTFYGSKLVLCRWWPGEWAPGWL